MYAVGYSLVAAFAAACFVSSVMLALYSRLERTMQQKIWPQFPRFLATCCAGSVFGAVAWAARAQSIALELAALAPYPPHTNASIAAASDTAPLACDLLFYSNYNASSPPPAAQLNRHMLLKSQGELWNGVFLVLYPVEFLLLTIAKGFPSPSPFSPPLRPTLPPYRD